METAQDVKNGASPLAKITAFLCFVMTVALLAGSLIAPGKATPLQKSQSLAQPVR